MTPLEQTLQTTLETMAKTNEMLVRQYEEEKARSAELSAKINELLAQIAWLQRKLFGRSSEKFNPDTHPSLFSEEELGAVSQLEETSMQQPEPTDPGATGKPKRRPVSRARQGWENLPVLKTVTLEPEGVDTERYRRMGEEVTYTVEI